SMIRGGRWSELVPYDQLVSEMRKEKVFFGYQEAKPIGSFPPTYRMMKMEQGYSNKKDQNPSFTDRILYRGHIMAQSYGANHELIVRPDRTLTNSDHRPIYASFEWEEEAKAWGEEITFEGADEKDIIVCFDGISYRTCSNGTDRVSIIPPPDENK